MRRSFRLVLPALLMLTALSAASASETAWLTKIVADNGQGYNSSRFWLGTMPNASNSATDGPTGESMDTPMAYLYPPGYAVGACLSFVIDGDSTQAYRQDIRCPIVAGESRKWDIRLYSLAAATYDSIRLSISTPNPAWLPPTVIAGRRYRHVLKMVDNRGMKTYANGTEWIIPVPTVHDTVHPYFTLTLPRISLSANDYAHANSEGYVLEYRVEPNPEPSGLLALGLGLIGLTALRRRRPGD